MNDRLHAAAKSQATRYGFGILGIFMNNAQEVCVFSRHWHPQSLCLFNGTLDSTFKAQLKVISDRIAICCRDRDMQRVYWAYGFGLVNRAAWKVKKTTWLEVHCKSRLPNCILFQVRGRCWGEMNFEFRITRILMEFPFLCPRNLKDKDVDVIPMLPSMQKGRLAIKEKCGMK